MDDNDHRVLGNRLDLFHQQEEGPGMVFWHPRGFAIYHAIEDYIRRRMHSAGFREIRTPQLLGRSLWEQSGHWEKFGAAMFSFSDADRAMALKPMSCPCHVQVFNRRLRSHRDLPLRYAEFGACHRDEPSGSLQGLMRTRAFVQDDAHVFCRDDQVEYEVGRFCAVLRQVYADFGFEQFDVAFSTRPAVRAGSDALWDRAEAMLARAARAAGLDCVVQPGEGAFYGPKLEFILPDRGGRRWQCGTIQLDFVLPDRLGAVFVTEDSGRATPVMIHHAVLGSLERFIALLLEHYRGDLPLWLAPEQVVVASVGPAQQDPVVAVAAQLEQAGLRVAVDTGPDTLSRKIVRARDQAIPIMAVVGAREAHDGTVALRFRDRLDPARSLAEVLPMLQRLASPPDQRSAVAGDAPP